MLLSWFCYLCQVDCVQSILEQTLEILSPYQLACLLLDIQGRARPGRAGGSAKGSAADQQPAGQQGRTAAGSLCQDQHGNDDPRLAPGPAAARLARYSLRRVQAVRQLVERLAVLPEAFEMGRVCGLTIPQVGLRTIVDAAIALHSSVLPGAAQYLSLSPAVVLPRWYAS